MFDNDSSASQSFNESKNGSYLGTRVRRLSESRLSPARVCRQQERQQLSCLNDRLAQYIDKVRRLEMENQKLVKTMIQYETQRCESTKMGEIYQVELNEAKNLMREMADENEKLKAETQISRGNFAKLSEKVNSLEDEVDQSRQKRLKSEEERQFLEKKIAYSQSQTLEFKNEQDYLAQENEKLRADIKSVNLNFLAQRQLVKENEICLEKRLEEFRIYKKNALQELEVCQSQEREVYVQEIDHNLETIYSNKLHDHLLQMRQELEEMINKNRSEIEENYSSKLENLHSTAELHYQTELDLKKQIQNHKSKLENLNFSDYKLTEKQREIEILTQKLSKNEEDYCQRLQNNQKIVEKLRNQLDEILNNYETLMGSKIQICKEIEQYQQMLQCEEERLCLSPAKRKIVKAKRLLEPNFEYQFKLLSSKLVKIEEIDRNGKFIKICNDSLDVDFPIGLWTLECKIDNQEPIVFKFHRKSNLKAGKTCTVYSSNCETIEHDPPEILVMKNQNWPNFESKIVRVCLKNASDEEISTAELNKIEIFTTLEPKNGHATEELTQKSAKCCLM